ncbi:hypothetical protein CY35_04G015700 [Sphagnum magellanicum]|nr:hypothetical protein CY35_04G015700 [Sphagnum magellanicum]
MRWTQCRWWRELWLLFVIRVKKWHNVGPLSIAGCKPRIIDHQSKCHSPGFNSWIFWKCTVHATANCQLLVNSTPSPGHNCKKFSNAKGWF